MLSSGLCWISVASVSPIVPGIGSQAQLMKMSTHPLKLLLTSSAMVLAQLGEKISATMPFICMFAGLVRDVFRKAWSVTSSRAAPFPLLQVPRMEQPRDARFRQLLVRYPGMHHLLRRLC